MSRGYPRPGVGLTSARDVTVLPWSRPRLEVHRWAKPVSEHLQPRPQPDPESVDARLASKPKGMGAKPLHLWTGLEAYGVRFDSENQRLLAPAGALVADAENPAWHL